MSETLRSRLKTTFLTVAHATNKSKDKVDLDFRGSSAYSAGFDATWITEKSAATRTVTLKPKWLKEADNLEPFCFQMKEVWPSGTELRTPQTGTVVLEYVDPHATKQREEVEARNWRLQTEAKMRELGMIGPLKGKTDLEFAEAWHAPAPDWHIPYKQTPAGPERDAMVAQMGETAAEELQAWQTEVERTRRRLRKELRGSPVAMANSLSRRSLGCSTTARRSSLWVDAPLGCGSLSRARCRE